MVEASNYIRTNIVGCQLIGDCRCQAYSLQA